MTIYSGINDIAGMRIIVSEHLAEFDLIPRPWKERLFTRPWQPWRAYNRIERPPQFLVDQARGIITTSPRGYLALKQEVGRA